jgi:hypothetical protein
MFLTPYLPFLLAAEFGYKLHKIFWLDHSAVYAGLLLTGQCSVTLIQWEGAVEGLALQCSKSHGGPLANNVIT